MSYQVRYDSLPLPVPTCKCKRKRIPLLIILLAGVLTGVAVLVLTGRISPDYLLPGDPEAVKAGLEALADSLREGQSISDSVTAFCKEILDGPKAIG